MLLACILYITPGITETYIPPAAFVQTPRQDWFLAGYLAIPAGDTLSCRFISNAPMTVGFSNDTAWSNFVDGSSPVLSLNHSASGLEGSFTLHALHDEHIVLVAHWIPQNTDYFKVFLTAYNYAIFHPYAYVATSLGLVTLAVSLTYERARSRIKRFR